MLLCLFAELGAQPGKGVEAGRHLIYIFYLNKILFLLMMDVAKFETFRNFIILIKTLVL